MVTRRATRQTGQSEPHEILLRVAAGRVELPKLNEMVVRAFYMGDTTKVDLTDAANSIEIGVFDRGPGRGYRSTYWFNGAIISSDEQRGPDIHERRPAATRRKMKSMRPQRFVSNSSMCRSSRT